jgi:hypothetical protein
MGITCPFGGCGIERVLVPRKDVRDFDVRETRIIMSRVVLDAGCEEELLEQDVVVDLVLQPSPRELVARLWQNSERHAQRSLLGAIARVRGDSRQRGTFGWYE